jgi:hypothetical protein
MLSAFSYVYGGQGQKKNLYSYQHSFSRTEIIVWKTHNMLSAFSYVYGGQGQKKIFILHVPVFLLDQGAIRIKESESKP